MGRRDRGERLRREGRGGGGFFLGGVVGDYRYNQYQLGLGVRFGRRLAAVY